MQNSPLRKTQEIPIPSYIRFLELDFQGRQYHDSMNKCMSMINKIKIDYMRYMTSSILMLWLILKNMTSSKMMHYVVCHM